MSLRSKLVLAITSMVFVLATASSYLYLAQFLRQRLVAAYDTADLLSRELAETAVNAVPDLTDTRVDTTDPEQLRQAIEDYLATDRLLLEQVRNSGSDATYVYDVSIVDADGNTLVHSNPAMVHKPAPTRPLFQQLRNAGFRQQLSAAYDEPVVYEVRWPIQLQGTDFGTARIGISTVLLTSEIKPKIQQVLQISLSVVLVALLLAAGLSQLVLSPLDRISQRLDRVGASDDGSARLEKPRGDEYGKVTSKIENLDRQMRDAREVFAALQNNVEQMMANLQDGLMLFARDGRTVLVSTAMERFLQRPHTELIGKAAAEIFSADTPLDALVASAFVLQEGITPRELKLNGRRVEVTLDWIEQRGTSIGAMLTLRDVESARRIEDEIEVSRRLSSTGRLTSGVAHEVKNPINAIVLHLENLRFKLNGSEPAAQRHMDIIENEIRRLDRVVQTLVDFTRPVALRVVLLNLQTLLQDVVALTTPDAAQANVHLTSQDSAQVFTVRADRDLIKQVLVNVVLNGIQAMPGGGSLAIAVDRDSDDVVVSIRDTGAGMPVEIQDRVFDLYFTTKTSGSGIGLAQAFQIMQLHHGSIDFDSEVGTGTTFRLRLPAEPLPTTAISATSPPSDKASA